MQEWRERATVKQVKVDNVHLPGHQCLEKTSLAESVAALLAEILRFSHSQVDGKCHQAMTLWVSEFPLSYPEDGMLSHSNGQLYVTDTHLLILFPALHGRQKLSQFLFQSSFLLHPLRAQWYQFVETPLNILIPSIIVDATPLKVRDKCLLFPGLYKLVFRVCQTEETQQARCSLDAALSISAPASAKLQGMTIKYQHCKSLWADESVPRAAGTLQKILFRKSLPKTRKAAPQELITKQCSSQQNCWQILSQPNTMMAQGREMEGWIWKTGRRIFICLICMLNSNCRVKKVCIQPEPSTVKWNVLP